MAFSRALSVISIISVSWLAAVGCGDDDSITQQSGAAGEGGEAGEGAGGTSVSGNGGTGNGGTGNGGTSSAGEAGNGTGGTAGDAGAGVGGQPVVGGAGGATQGPIAGAAGDGGAGGEPPTVLKAKQCAYQCEEDADCLRIDGLTDQCNPVTKRCEDPQTACSDNEDCVPFGNYLEACDAAADCEDGYDCVVFDGTGFCAPLADTGSVCEDASADAVSVAKQGSAGQSTVCVYQTARCNAGACIFGCADPLFGNCGLGAGDSCNPDTGFCECAASTECTASGGSVCGANSLCGCAASTECAAANVAGQSVCVASTCGCESAQECPAGGYAAPTPVCE